MSYARQVGLSASEERIDKLINERLAPGADKESIDKRIKDLFEETWTVMFTDLTGFSRGVESFGIIHFLQIIHESLRILVPRIDAHDGIILKTEGDSLLVIFRRPESAVECALSMQRSLLDYNAQKPDEEKILLCIGLGSGPVLRIGDRDVFGSEVNAASKLGEDTAKGGEILVTESLVRHLPQNHGLCLVPLPDAPAGANAAFSVTYPQERRNAPRA